MSAKTPSSKPPAATESAPGQREATAGTRALPEAARAWAALVDGWWRQQAAALPPDLERAMTSTLDQSKALVDMVCAQALDAFSKTPSKETDEMEGRPAADASHAGEMGLWQPVLDARRAFEATLLGAVSETIDNAQDDAAQAYRRAADAYLNEFVRINAGVVERVRKRLAAADSDPDFRSLHALVVEEAEKAYLDHVSADAFAALQAEFINALFRLSRRMRTSDATGGETTDDT